MSKDNVTNRVSTKKEWVFTKPQLEAFGVSFSRYMKVVTLGDGKVVTVPDWETIYFRAGVKTTDGRVTHYEENGKVYFHIDKFDEMYRQWRKIVDPKVYGEQKKLEQLSQTFDQINAEEVFANY